MELGGEFTAETGDVGYRGDVGGAEFFDVAEVFEQRRAADGAKAGKIIEHALADFARAQIGVVGVSEAVGFVAQALKEIERWGIKREIERRTLVGENDRLVFFRQPDERRRRKIEGDKGFERGADLSA